MEQEVQVDEGISLLDIFKLLLSRIKLLILVTIIGGLIGGGYAVYTTYNVNYYGSEVQFYVNPKKKLSGDSVSSESQYSVYGAYGQHVMDGVVKLLNSDLFLEYIFLDGETLPAKDFWATEAEEEKLGLNKLIDESAAAIQAANEAAIASDAAVSAANEALKQDPESEATKQKISEAARLTEETEKKVAASRAKQEEMRDAWNATAKYKAQLSKYKGKINSRFLAVTESSSDSQNLARSFIYVSISVLNDEEFAQQLLQDVKTYVPLYVEQKMPVPGGDYDGTNCERTTRTDQIRLTNPRYTTNEAIKYGLIMGLAAFVLTCVIVILLDKSDKRLRDPDIISKKFYVPVLGVVPNIAEMSEPVENADDKTATEVL